MEASNDERAAPVDGGGALEEDPLTEAVDWLAHYAPEAAVASKKLDDGKRSQAADQVTPSRSLQQTAKLRSPDVHQALHEHRRPMAVVGFT